MLLRFLLSFLILALLKNAYGAFPKFSSPFPNGTTVETIKEDSSIASSIYDVVATDSDGDTLTFSVINGSKFIIDGKTLKSKDVFDYENATDRNHSVVIRASDGVNHTDVTMTVFISDVNDNSPVLSPAVFKTTIKENTPPGTSLLDFTCNDKDSGLNGNCVISILKGDDHTTKFNLSGNQLQTSSNTIDFETLIKTTYTLIVIGKDNPLSGSPKNGTAYVFITVEGVNEFKPTFTNNRIVSLSEDAVVGSTVVKYTATDNDTGAHGDLKYKIKSVTNGGTGVFTVQATTGNILLSQTVDYESVTEYKIIVVATDGGGLEGSGTVTVSITDVNDNTPECSPVVHVISLPENTTINTKVTPDLNCLDHDSGINGRLSYKMTTNPDDKFKVVESAGHTYIYLKAKLDYELKRFYTLRVTVSDSGVPIKSAILTIHVTVLNINEDTPVFTKSGKYNKSVPENTAIGTTLIKVSATDGDLGDTVTYGLDNKYNQFNIDPSTGEVFLIQKLDWETKPSHVILVTAADNGGLIATSTVVITVDDINEPPVFPFSKYSVSIDENQSPGTAVRIVNASDLDSGINGRLSYSIIAGNGIHSFRIYSVTGNVFTTKKLDYESQNFYDIVIQASDGASPSLSATTLLTVKIKDLNDNPPIFIPTTYTLSIYENVTIGTTVTRVTASDADSNSHGNNILDFSLQGSYPFSIDASTGIIVTNSRLDRETKASYDLLILAKDGGSPKQIGTCTLTVMLIDVNDNSPSVNGVYDISIFEDTPINTVITTVNATDADEGDNSRLTYDITKGNAYKRFKIESTSGLIQTTKTFDREDISVYKLKITITDHGTIPLYTTATVTVTLKDVNDNVPAFTRNYFTFTVDENVRRGTVVGRLIANDRDIGNNAQLNYEILGFWTGVVNPFYIEPRTGRVRVNGNIDREIISSYNLWCRVSDSGTPLLSSDVNVSISVNDVNDNDPLFSKALYSNTTIEDSVVGTFVLSVSATDADIGTNAYLSYSIDLSSKGGALASQYFQINSKTGEISVRQKVDRETDQDFNFTVQVSDAGSPKRIDSALIFISVEDINDNIPVFSPAFYNSEVPYTDSCKTTILTLTATDDDIGINTQPSYQLLQSRNNDLFSLSSTTGQLILSGSVARNMKYVLHANVSDNGWPKLTSNISAVIRVDSFVPEEVVLTFYMNIGKEEYLRKETKFINLLSKVYKNKYPTAYVKRWCCEKLSSKSVKVHLYVIENNSADEESEINNGKPFLLSDKALSLVAETSGEPGHKISGFTWNEFGIQKVTSYLAIKSEVPWIQTTVGIAVTVTCSVAGTALLIVGIILTSKYCGTEGSVEPKEFKPIKPSRVTIEEPKHTDGVSENYVLPAPIIVPTNHLQPTIKNTINSLNTTEKTLQKLNQNLPKNRNFTGRVVDRDGKILEFDTSTNERKFLKVPRK